MIRCVPQEIYTESQPLSKTINMLNCIYTRSTLEQWEQGLREALKLQSRGGWIDVANNNCNRFLGTAKPACFKHDLAYGTLQNAVSNASREGPPQTVMDAAWNPRNKLWADWVLLDELAHWYCEPGQSDLYNGWEREVCENVSEFTLANVFFFEVQGITGNDWPVSLYDFHDVSTNEEFTACETPRVETMSYSNAGYFMIANWTLSEYCVPGLRTEEKFAMGWGYDKSDGTSDTTSVASSTVTERTAEQEIPKTLQPVVYSAYPVNFRIKSVDSLYLLDELPLQSRQGEFAPLFAAPPDQEGGAEFSGHATDLLIRQGIENLRGGWLATAKRTLRDGYYAVEQKYIPNYDTRILILSFSTRESNRPFSAGTNVDLTIRAVTSIPSATLSYAWQEWKGSDWENYINTSEGNSTITYERTVLKRTFRVRVTANTSSGQQRDAANTGTAFKNSDPITIEWEGAAATPTPTPTPTATPIVQPETPSTGTLSLTRSAMQIGQGTTVKVAYTLAEGKLATLKHTAGVSSRSNCSSSGAAQYTTSGTAGAYIGTFYGCTAGTVTFDLVESPGDTVLATQTLTITPATASTATITASDTSIEVGESTEVTFTFRLAPNVNFASIFFGDHLARKGRCRSNVRAASSRSADEPNQGNMEVTLAYTLYGCSPGTSSVKIGEAGGSVIASLNIVVSAAPVGATPTPTPTPSPTGTPTPSPTPTPTPTPAPVPESSAVITVSDDDITVGERTNVTVSYVLGPEDAVARTLISDHLNRNPRCPSSSEPRNSDERTDSSTVDYTLYGCRAGTGTIEVREMPRDILLASAQITVNARATATPTPSPSPSPTPTATSTPNPTATPTLVPPRITGSSLSGTRLRIDYTRPSGTSYYRFRIYRSYYGENDFSEYDSETDLRSPVYFSGLPRGYTYYVRGQSCRDGSYSDCDGLGNRSATRTVPTVTPTPTPTRTPVPTATATPTATSSPVPSTGSLSSSRSSIRIGQSSRVTARYTLGSGATEARLSYTSHVSVDSSCPNRSDTREHVLARAVDRYTLYGCTAGTATVRLLEMPGRRELDSLTIRVTSPPTATPTRTATPAPTATPVPVPKPTNLRYGAGETWINFVWDEPSGYNNNEITFDGDTWETSNYYYFASGLAPGSEYTLKVKTVASDGRKSSAASIAAETECDVICYRRQSGEADVADDKQPPARQFGDGVHRIGVQIQQGTYAVGSPIDTSECEWQLYSSDGGGRSGGWVERMLITMGENDAAIYSSGCGTWYKQEE